MNKFFLAGLLLTTNVFAGSPETVIILEAQTTRGKVVSKDVVIVKEGIVTVNKETLSPSEIITQSEHITQISIIKTNETNYQCESGRYLHILQKGKLLKEEKGCLESARYKYLKENFKALRKDRITE